MAMPSVSLRTAAGGVIQMSTMSTATFRTSSPGGSSTCSHSLHRRQRHVKVASRRGAVGSRLVRHADDADAGNPRCSGLVQLSKSKLSLMGRGLPNSPGHEGRKMASGYSEGDRLNGKARRGSLAVRALGEFLTHGNVHHIYGGDDLKKHLEDASEKLVVLDISTKTCGPCKLIYPKLVKMSEEYGEAVFLKIEGDHDASTRLLMREWGIRSVPCFRFYRKGELIHSHTGAKEEVLRTNFLKYYQAQPVEQTVES